MATKDQYEFFKSIYAEHLERRKALETRAQLYFTIQSLYFGIVVLKVGEMVGIGNTGLPTAIGTQFPPLYQGFQCAVATFLAFAICLTLWSVRVRTYQTVTDPEEVARDLLDEHVELMSDEEFFKRRIVDFSVAANWNEAKNWEAARNALGLLVMLAVSLIAWKGAKVRAKDEQPKRSR
jgi:hypothetical protein